jgi:hypothetical protein
MTFTDSLISIGILLFIALMMYSKFQHQSMGESVKGIIDIFRDVKEEGEEYVPVYA